MSQSNKPRNTFLFSKPTKAKPTPPKVTNEEKQHADMAKCLNVTTADAPDPEDFSAMKGKRPNMGEIAWYWLPANQENLSQPGNYCTFIIPEAMSMDPQLPLPRDRPQVSSVESERLQTDTTDDPEYLLLISDFEHINVKPKACPVESSSKTMSTDRISKPESTSLKTSLKKEDEIGKNFETPDSPSIEKSAVPSTSEEEKFSKLNRKQDTLANFKLDQFTHGFYELLAEIEEKGSSKSRHSSKDSSDVELHTVSGDDFILPSTSDTESQHTTIDPFTLNFSTPPVSDRSPKIHSDRPTTPISDRSKPDINYSVEFIFARTSDRKSDDIEFLPGENELFVSGFYPLYTISERTEPTSSCSDFQDSLYEFHYKSSNRPLLESESELSDCKSSSEFETVDISDTEVFKLQMFNKQELKKYPPSKLGIRFKQILRVNGTLMYDCRCNYHLLPARYQKKYQNPENILMEFNHLLLHCDQVVYFSTHYCPFTIQEMNDIMEITGGLKYLPQSYIKQYILNDIYQKPPKRLEIEYEESTTSSEQRPVELRIRAIDEDECSSSDSISNLPIIVLPSLEARIAGRRGRPVTRRADSDVKRPQ